MRFFPRRPVRRFFASALIRGSAFAAALLLAAPALAQSPGGAAKVYVGPAFAMHGDVKYKPDFRHFDYADPKAIKGGDVKFHAIGTFDSFNTFILRGVPTGLVLSTYDQLMAGSSDEPFTRYCLVCETIEVPADRSWVAFNLRPEARFHDGSPITPEDVIWTFETLKTKGHPSYRSYYAGVMKAEKTGPRQVKFTFTPGEENNELPLIVSELYVLPRAYWQSRDFEKTTLEPPLGSGPYRIDSFEAGRFVTLRRVPDYWAINLPVNVGKNNFDVIRYDYYRDQTVALEAFKAGEYDIRPENQALAWATLYESPALAAGLIKKVEIPTRTVSGMQGFAMNTRRDAFKDPRVRQALVYAFDFEWSNKNLFHGAYTRTRSYFDNSELAATGLPSPADLKLLDPFRGKIPDEVFTAEYNPPKTDGSGNWRENQRIATRLLREAGYRVDNNRLVDAAGNQLGFEFLLNNPQFERVVLPYVENLKRLGIAARVRTIDTAQYQRRMDEFDFDMTVDSIPQSESPGNEQRNYWHSSKVKEVGSANLIGVSNPAVDALIDLIISAPDRESLVARVRALDRVLQWGHYVVPNWHTRTVRVAYWDRFSWPTITPRQGYAVSYWWVDPQKDAALRERRGRSR
ncbi:MAG: ABC transporter substrate-binding protein [Rhodospirillales bacterium]|nr:ABC transporter substrate-binding protein [Rhodospirillales bacterium]